MNTEIRKEQLIDFVEEVITPASVVDITYVQAMEDAHGETNIWLVVSDTEEAYWVLEGSYPANLYKRVGIFSDIEHVFDVYCTTSEMLLNQDGRD